MISARTLIIHNLNLQQIVKFQHSKSRQNFFLIKLYSLDKKNIDIKTNSSYFGIIPVPFFPSTSFFLQQKERNFFFQVLGSSFYGAKNDHKLERQEKIFQSFLKIPKMKFTFVLNPAFCLFQLCGKRFKAIALDNSRPFSIRDGA